MSKTIVREGYTRSAYHRKAYHRMDGTFVHAADVAKTVVPPARIAARGRAAITGHKGAKVINLVGPDEKHLGSYGYHIKEAQTTRHRALGKAVAHYEAVPVFRRLVALSTLFKNTEPSLSKRAHSDAKFVHDRYFTATKRKAAAKK
jgi:hypothetical protein